MNNWIDPKDALPEPETSIIFACGDEVFVGFHSGTSFYAQYAGDNYYYKRNDVTHWQALPAPPTKR